MADILVDSLRKQDLNALRAVIRKDANSARSPRAVVEAGRLAWKPGLEELLRAGADLNGVWRGYRALHALIQENPHRDKPGAPPARVACLKWLLKHGVNADLPAAWPSARAILVAAFTGEPAYVDALLAGGATVNGFALAALGDLSGVKKCLKKNPAFARARDDGGGLTALQCAAASRMRPERKRLEVARLLIHNGADVNARTPSWSHEVDAVGLATGAAQTDIVALLLDHGASAGVALSGAMWRYDLKLAELALRHGASLDALCDGKPLLNQLVRWGQIKPALWLLEKGANPNLPDERGWTAVHQAASRGNERMMRALLAAGGDVRRQDTDGNRPADVAFAMRKTRMLELIAAV